MQQLLSESVSERKRIAKEGGLRHTKQRKRVVFFSGGVGGRISSISASAASSIICRSWLVPSRLSMLLDYLTDALALFCWFRLLAAYGLCWRMRLRGDSHPPAGRPRGSPLLWTGLESRFPRGIVGATLVVARLDRSMLVSFCIPSVIRQQSPAAAHPGREWVRAVPPAAAQPAPTPYLANCRRQ